MSRQLITLQFVSTNNYQDNLTTLTKLIKDTPEDSIILAPEVCLTGFDYDNFEDAANFSLIAMPKLLELSKTRIISLTMIEKDEKGDIYNHAKVLHNEKVLHVQSKNRLFKLGNEDKFFKEGEDEHLSVFEVDGIKFGLLICFELRFKNYWIDLEGADIILVPARWGKIRSENFKVLTQSLAIINQCYVMASDASNDDCTSMSGIITPFGKDQRNGNNLCLKEPYDAKEIKRMRRYLAVGIGEVS